jgi:hypothetical protein
MGNASANIHLKVKSAKNATHTTSGRRIHLGTLYVNLIPQSALMSFAMDMAHAQRELALLNAFAIRGTPGNGARNALTKISSTLSVMVTILISQMSKVALNQLDSPLINWKRLLAGFRKGKGLSINVPSQTSPKTWID